ncbi:hypothetical protein AB0465_14595 [Streptomyces griseoviridis]
MNELYDEKHVNDVEKFFKEYVLREDEAFVLENGGIFIFQRNP